MAKLLIPLALLLVLALAVTAFLVISDDGDHSARAARSAKVEAETAAVADDAGDRSSRSQVEAAPAPAPEPTKEAPQSPWTGGLKGRVITSAGQPVASASVRLRKELQEDEAVALGFEWSGDPLKESQETQTDAEGAFAFASVPPFNDCQVEITGTGGLVARKTATVPNGRVRDLGTIIVKTGGTLAGVVRSSLGGPVAGAKVRFGDQLEAATQNDGRFSFTPVAPSRYWGMVTAEGYGDTMFPEVRLKEGESVTDLELVLDAGLSISGRVVDPDGKPVKGAQVQAYRQENQQWLSGKPTADDGSFTVLGLSAGDYQLNVWSENAGWASANAAAGARDVELKIQGGVYVSGTVVDAITSKPVHAKRFEVQRNYGGDNFYTEASTKADEVQGEDGTFHVTVPRRAESKLRILVVADGYLSGNSEPLQVANDSIEGLLIALQPGGDLNGRVVDAASQAGIANCRVMLQRKIDQPRTRDLQVFTVRDEFQSTGTSVRSSPDGAFHLSGIGPGTYRLSLTCSGFAPRFTQPLNVRAGVPNEPQDIALERGNVLVGRVHDGEDRGIAGFGLRLTGEEGASSDGMSDDEGRFTFDDLAPGRYALDVSGRRRGPTAEIAALIAQVYQESDPKKPPRLVVIAAGETAQCDFPVEVPRCGRVAGTVYENGSPAPRLSVMLSQPQQPGQRKPGQPFNRRQPFSSQTDRAGTYEIENVLPGSYQISVQGEGLFGGGPQANLEVHAGEDLSFDVKLNTSALSIATRDADTGAPISAQVTVGQVDARPSRAKVLQSAMNPWRFLKQVAFNGWSGAQGECSATRIREGSYVVLVTAQGYLPELLESISVGASGASVEARLHAGGTIRIKIDRAFDPTLAVSAESIPSAEQPSEERVRLVARWQDQSECYEIQSVPPGKWRVEAKSGKGLSDEARSELSGLGYMFNRRSNNAKVAPYEGAGAQSEVDLRAHAAAEVKLALP